MAGKATTARKALEHAWLDLSGEEQDALRESAKQTWLSAFNATKQVRCYCPTCDTKVYAEFPDTLNQAKALEILSTIAFGEQPKVVHHEVDFGALTLEAISGMSMAQLAELGALELDADGMLVDIEDAEFEVVDDEQPALPA